jgi:hypothetical protein
MKTQLPMLHEHSEAAWSPPLGLLIVGALVIGCSVGWKYSYRGQEYSMTQSNIDYHKKVVADVQQKYGILVGAANIQEVDVSGSTDSISAQLPKLKKQADSFQGACTYIKSAAVQGPDGGGFTPASALLTNDATETCKAADNATEQVAKVEKAIKEKEQQALRQEEEDKKKADAAAAEKRWESIKGVLAQCESQMRPVPCDVDGITDKERKDCSDRCNLIIETSLLKVASESAKACADKFAANKKKAPTCEIKLPDGNSISADKVEQTNRVCVGMCKERIDQAAAALEENKRTLGIRSSGSAASGSNRSSSRSASNKTCTLWRNTGGGLIQGDMCWDKNPFQHGIAVGTCPCSSSPLPLSH